MKRQKKPLKLSRETLRSPNVELSRVVGGNTTPIITCLFTIPQTQCLCPRPMP